MTFFQQIVRMSFFDWDQKNTAPRPHDPFYGHYTCVGSEKLVKYFKVIAPRFSYSLKPNYFGESENHVS